MRTKALFVAAATGLAALSTSMAQVYSVNVVGYINVDLQPGFNLVANQLDNGNGNIVADLLGESVSEGTTVYKWNGGGYDIATLDFGDWGVGTSMTMNPGEGVWILNPDAGATTITFVGEVVEGANDVTLPAGFSIFSSVAPVVTDLSAASASFPAEEGDVVYQWTGAGYTISTFDFGAWDPAAPALGVGEAAWINKVSASTWTRDFSVPRQ